MRKQPQESAFQKALGATSGVLVGCLTVPLLVIALVVIGLIVVWTIGDVASTPVP